MMLAFRWTVRAESAVMSPVSRGRKKRKNRTGNRSQAELFVVPEACDCPVCTGEDLDADLFDEVIGNLVGVSSELPDDADPLEAQTMAGSFLALCAATGGRPEAIASGLIPVLEATGNDGALNLLLATAAVAENPVAAAAAAAAGRLVSTGLRTPTWAA